MGYCVTVSIYIYVYVYVEIAVRSVAGPMTIVSGYRLGVFEVIYQIEGGCMVVFYIRFRIDRSVVRCVLVCTLCYSYDY